MQCGILGDLFYEDSGYDLTTHTYKDNAEVKIKRMGDFLQHTSLTAHILWPASEMLCDFIAVRSEFFKNRTLLELGAGVGLCGILASRFTSKAVLTDGKEDVMEVLRENIELNGSSAEAEVLFWSQEEAKAFLSRHNDEKFDVIIGSDVLFEFAALEGHFQTAHMLLKDSSPLPANADTDPRYKCLPNELSWDVVCEPDEHYLIQGFLTRGVMEETILQIADRCGFELYRDIDLDELLLAAERCSREEYELALERRKNRAVRDNEKSYLEDYRIDLYGANHTHEYNRGKKLRPHIWIFRKKTRKTTAQ